MKIFYAVQATGNGHISRANQIVPYLKMHGEVDVFLSGNNYSLEPNFNLKYKSNGLSLIYNECGSINYLKTATKNSIFTAIREAKELPVDKYDIIINDFDFITAYACKSKNVRSLQFGHQASFMSPNVPRPSNKQWFGEYVLKKFAVASDYVGLHFRQYDDFVYPPIIKETILNAKPQDQGYISVYLPSVLDDCIFAALSRLKQFRFQWFLKGIKEIKTLDNITYMPVNDDLFSRSLINCHGLITGGGFETPSEALYLKKKLMVVPIMKHYEQLCNAAALEELNVYTVRKPNFNTFDKHILDWMSNDKLQKGVDASNTDSLVRSIISVGY